MIQRLSLPWRLLHWVILAHFIIEIIYCAYIIFVVLQPEGASGPLFEAAATLDPEQLVARRLYAIECWIATAGFAIYLALTELLPRAGRASSADQG